VTDPQSTAYREATEADWVDDRALAAMVARGELADTTGAPVVDVDEYEAASWDSGRERAKTLAEARAALRARVADPAAPDADPHAYDA